MAEDLNKLFEEFGVEMEMVEGDGLEYPASYQITKINDMWIDDYYQGNPQLSKIIVSEFPKRDDNGNILYTGNVDDNGEEIPVTETKYRVDFALVDDIEEVVYIIGLNIKSNDPVQKNIGSQSKLFELIKGLLEMRSKGCTEGFNFIKQVDLDLIREQLADIESMRIKIVGKSFGNVSYNSFIVVEDE